MSCTANRLYPVTVPADGSMANLLFRRTDSGASNPDGDQGMNFLRIVFPSEKQNGTANPGDGKVILLWSDSDDIADVTQANTIVQAEIEYTGAVNIPLASYRNGWFYVFGIGGSAIEIHCTETSR